MMLYQIIDADYIIYYIRAVSMKDALTEANDWGITILTIVELDSND